MADETGNDWWAEPAPPGPTPHEPASLSGEWSPPRTSSLPPPPPPPASAVVATGVVEPTLPPQRRWTGRLVALGAAALLVGGGGYLAINAGASDGGADSPEAAVEGVFDALADEDLIGAATYVEPLERETMVEAGFDVVEELVRLDVFSDELDLASVPGFDFEFADLEVTATEVRPGLAHVFLTGGEAFASIDGSQFPLGSLITDRVDADTFSIQESTSGPIRATETPIVAVERDGRWYLSLWYSVAENARMALDQPIPEPAGVPVPVGGATPEEAIEAMVAATFELDLATMIGMLDPEEAAALYDYAPLFLDDAQQAVDDLLAEADEAGWQWESPELQLRAETDGSLSTVHVDWLSFTAGGPEGSVDVMYTADETQVDIDVDDTSVVILIEGDCVTITVDEGDGPETETACADDLVEEAGLEALTTGAFADLRTAAVPGMVVREVDGRWYVSPLRTGSAAVLGVLRTIEPDGLAESVDALIEFAEDPFALGSDFGTDFGFGLGEEIFEPICGSIDASGPTTVDCEPLEPIESVAPSLPPDPTEPGAAPDPETTIPDVEFPAMADDNAALLSPEFEPLFVHDLVDPYRSDPWFGFLAGVEERDYDEGVVGDVYFGDLNVEVTVFTGMEFADDEELAAWVGGDLVTDGDLTYVRGITDWGGDFAVARSGDGLVVVGAWFGWEDAVVDALRAQVTS